MASTKPSFTELYAPGMVGWFDNARLQDGLVACALRDDTGPTASWLVLRAGQPTSLRARTLRGARMYAVAGNGRTTGGHSNVSCVISPEPHLITVAIADLCIGIGCVVGASGAPLIVTVH